MPTFASDLDLKGDHFLAGSRVEQFAGAPTAPKESRFWYDSTISEERLYFRDKSKNVPIPRLDKNEVWTGVPAFVPATGDVPFSVDPTANGIVNNLNADRVDDFHASQSAASNTVAVRNADGTLAVADPVSDTHAASKGWTLTLLSQGLAWDEVRAASKGVNLNLISVPANIGGVVMAPGDRFLAPSQTVRQECGLYVYPAAAGQTASRATDADSTEEFTQGKTVLTLEGDNAGAVFSLFTTEDEIILGTTELIFQHTGGVAIIKAGNGLVKEGNDLHFGKSTAYGVGDLPYCSGSNTIDFLSSAAVGNVLKAQGPGNPPIWALVDLTSDVTGVLQSANGGTNTSEQFPQGSVVVAGPSGVYAQDKQNLFWNATEKKLGIKTDVPTQDLTVAGSLSADTLFLAGLQIGDTSLTEVSLGGIDGTLDVLKLYANGSPVMTLNGAGNAILGDVSDIFGTRLNVVRTIGLAPAIDASTVAAFASTAAAADSSNLSIIAGNQGQSRVLFGDTDAESPGLVEYDHVNNSMALLVNGLSTGVHLNNAGNFGIGKSDPGHRLSVLNTAAEITMLVQGGNQGRPLARFHRNQGADVSVIIGAANSEPQIQFVGLADQWSLGKATADSGKFQIAYNAAATDNGLASGRVDLTLDDANGFAGLGVTDPQDRLHVAGTIRVDSPLNDWGVLMLHNGHNSGLWNAANDAILYLRDAAGSARVVMSANGSGANSYVLDLVGFGTAAPDASNQVTIDRPTSGTGTIWQDNTALLVRDDRSFAEGVGGGILFQGKYNLAGGQSTFGWIKSRKSNGVDGNVNGDLVIGARGGDICFVNAATGGNQGIDGLRLKIDSDGTINVPGLEASQILQTDSANNLVAAALVEAQIPNINAGKIQSGTFGAGNFHFQENISIAPGMSLRSLAEPSFNRLVIESDANGFGAANAAVLTSKTHLALIADSNANGTGYLTFGKGSSDLGVTNFTEFGRFTNTGELRVFGLTASSFVKTNANKGLITVDEILWSDIDSATTPTTLAGYGITDAASLSHGHGAEEITNGTLSGLFTFDSKLTLSATLDMIAGGNLRLGHSSSLSLRDSGTTDLEALGIDASNRLLLGGGFSAVLVPSLTASQIVKTDAAKGLIAAALTASEIPSLAASKISSGTFANGRISQGSVTQHQAALTILASQVDNGTLSGLFTFDSKLTLSATLDMIAGGNLRLGNGSSLSFRDSGTTDLEALGIDASNRLLLGNDFSAVLVPSLTASQIVKTDAAKGLIAAALTTSEIPSLAASKISSGTFANGRISQGSVTQHQAALTILSSQITNGDMTGVFNFLSVPTVSGNSVVRKVSFDVGNGTDVAFTLSHGLNTEDVEVIVRLKSGTKEREYPDWEPESSTSIKVTFGEIPSMNEYRVTVIG